MKREREGKEQRVECRVGESGREKTRSALPLLMYRLYPTPHDYCTSLGYIANNHSLVVLALFIPVPLVLAFPRRVQLLVSAFV